MTATFLGTLIGAITLTGSAMAFGKLHGVLNSAPLSLPGAALASRAVVVWRCGWCCGACGRAGRLLACTAGIGNVSVELFFQCCCCLVQART